MQLIPWGMKIIWVSAQNAAGLFSHLSNAPLFCFRGPASKMWAETQIPLSLMGRKCPSEVGKSNIPISTSHGNGVTGVYLLTMYKTIRQALQGTERGIKQSLPLGVHKLVSGINKYIHSNHANNKTTYIQKHVLYVQNLLELSKRYKVKCTFPFDNVFLEVLFSKDCFWEVHVLQEVRRRTEE